MTQGPADIIWTRQTSGWGDLERGVYQNAYMGSEVGVKYLAATPAREAADAMLSALEELHADCIARADKNGVVPIGRGAFMMLEAAMSKARGQGQ